MNKTNTVTVHLMAWAMAITPASLGILFHTGVRSIPLSIEVPSQPALAFHQYAVDLRKIHPTAEVPATFVFQNRGTEPVRITAMEPSCGCLTPLLQGDSDKVIPPGEQGRIIVRMQPANTTVGPHEYTVDVKYTDPEPRETRLTLKLEIPPATLTVSPPALIVYHPKGSEPTTYDFTVTDGRGSMFDIEELIVNSDLVEAAIGETSRTPTGKFQHTVRVSIAGELPPARTQILLRIRTTDPDFPELRVPLMLQGPPQSTADASASGLDHDHQ
ncbi:MULTISPECIES: DUF1573 domain-containing protein [unclassified Schlesneria]|uniref:DUF1573 domain-containing protein n=1 Tax=Schlesneria TaxID=656899 RepID=UPI00359F16CF